MPTRNIENERIKRRYFEFLKQADGKSDKTILQVEKAILRYEEFTEFVNLKSFSQTQAIGYKNHLADQDLALATILSALNNLKRFFAWLSLVPGYKKQICKTDIEYLNMSEKDTRAASAPVDKKFPTLPMIESIVSVMPSDTAIEKRDRALVAFIAITGIRDGAIITLKIKHFDMSRMLVLQNPLEVATKFSKRIDTFLLPLNDKFEQIVLDWIGYLKTDQLFADHDPIFPKTKIGHDKNDCFVPIGLLRDHWANASPIRAIVKKAFRNASLPTYAPHSFRDMIVSEMYARNLSVAQFKAWSQNLGHEGVMTTLNSYGKIVLEEQGRLIREPRSIEESGQPLTRMDLEEVLLKRGM